MFNYNNNVSFKISLLLLSLLISKLCFASNHDKIILGIFAHADDEITVSPILAKYANQNTKIYLAFATDGQHGVTAHAQIPAGPKLTKIRAKEAECACKKLRAEAPILFGFEDGTLMRPDTHSPLHNKIQILLDQLKPDIVLTWGPDGGYGHPDHRMISNVVTEVFQKNSNNNQQLYYAGLPVVDLNKLPKVNTEIGEFFKYKFHRTDNRFLPIQISYSKDNLETARLSYLCHKSQYTNEEVNEIFALISALNGTSYLRSWTNQAQKITTVLFKPKE